jgi:hypothetical protein
LRFNCQYQSYMVTFSATDSATTTDFGSPTTLRVLDLEDTSAYASLMSHAARHRLPVFLNLKDDSSNTNTIGVRGTPHWTGEMESCSKKSCDSIGQPTAVTRGVNKGLESIVLRRRVSPIRTMCGSHCDGVTCLLSVASVNEAPCLKVEEIKENLDKCLSFSGIPIPDRLCQTVTDRLCPFHHIPSLWLVPRCSFIISPPSKCIFVKAVDVNERSLKSCLKFYDHRA